MKKFAKLIIDDTEKLNPEIPEDIIASVLSINEL